MYLGRLCHQTEYCSCLGKAPGVRKPRRNQLHPRLLCIPVLGEEYRQLTHASRASSFGSETLCRSATDSLVAALRSKHPGFSFQFQRLSKTRRRRASASAAIGSSSRLSIAANIASGRRIATSAPPSVPATTTLQGSRRPIVSSMLKAR